ncbi:hypothetical protein [Bifidobacterium sp. UBA744]|nr:hypothetical protein [Bifidobacterium sp. UBA744]
MTTVHQGLVRTGTSSASGEAMDGQGLGRSEVLTPLSASDALR